MPRYFVVSIKAGDYVIVNQSPVQGAFSVLAVDGNEQPLVSGALELGNSRLPLHMADAGLVSIGVSFPSVASMPTCGVDGGPRPDGLDRVAVVNTQPSP